MNDIVSIIDDTVNDKMPFPLYKQSWSQNNFAKNT